MGPEMVTYKVSKGANLIHWKEWFIGVIPLERFVSFILSLFHLLLCFHILFVVAKLDGCGSLSVIHRRQRQEAPRRFPGPRLAKASIKGWWYFPVVAPAVTSP